MDARNVFDVMFSGYFKIYTKNVIVKCLFTNIWCENYIGRTSKITKTFQKSVLWVQYYSKSRYYVFQTIKLSNLTWIWVAWRWEKKLIGKKYIRMNCRLYHFDWKHSLKTSLDTFLYFPVVYHDEGKLCATRNYT